ncbi:hypothetical protein AU255_02325 [Methyloprofundus sedimenti]|uniref:Uncharacterized protein n=1 Tax=Methyloprofundus sedimenti TaxID=1420851 RepID=A0A1V8M5D1_9GAMM|nr:hypothetical protein AU255_02325 [Methyloprofundus sedimenti]
MHKPLLQNGIFHITPKVVYTSLFLKCWERGQLARFYWLSFLTQDILKTVGRGFSPPMPEII